jgi:hypothetical protein
MTYYGDYAAPRLSDFQVNRRLYWEDFATMGHWPFTRAGHFDLLCGSIWNADINRFEAPDPDPALLYNQSWASVIFGQNTANTFSLSSLMGQSLDISGDTDSRKAQVIAALLNRLTAVGCDPELIEVSDWRFEGISYWADATGLAGGLAFADPGDDDRDADDYLDEYRALIWDGVPGESNVKSDWQASVAAWIDDKIENNGWAFYKPWQSFPMVAPLLHHGNLGTSRSEAYAAGDDWYMGIDFWALNSKKIGDEVPWRRFTQMQDMRDPEDPNYLITDWHPQVAFQAGTFPSRFHAYVSGANADDRRTYHFVETLDGDRPPSAVEASNWLGIENTNVNNSIPGLLIGQGTGGYFDWVGWKKKVGGAGEQNYEKPFRLYAVMALPEQLLGCTSMEDLLAQENVATAFTVECYPYSETGPAADSRFGPTFFMAQPNAQARIRLATILDGGGP